MSSTTIGSASVLGLDQVAPPSAARRSPLTALYPAIRARMEGLALEAWPDLTREIERHVTRFDLPPAALLPIATCAAAGGSPRSAVGASAALGFVLLAARWLDDAADRDRADGLWATIGSARCTLFGVSAQSLAFQALASDRELPRESATRLASYMLWMAKGQDSDLAGRVESLEDYWQLMRGKTGAGFALACELGALSARTDRASTETLARFGLHLGLLLQVLDDLEGCFRPVGTGDLRQGKVTLPVVYAMVVVHPRQRELLDLVHGGNLALEAERALAIVEAAGAREYLVWAALEERKQALALLERLPKSSRDSCVAGRHALHEFLLLPFRRLPELAGSAFDES